MTREIISFEAAIGRVCERGFISDLIMLEEGVYTGKVLDRVGSTALARIMAQWLPGQGFPLKGEGGLTWRVGSKSFGVLVSPASLEAVYEAQGITQGLLQGDYKAGWTIGNLSRQLLRYVRPGEQASGYMADAERLNVGTPYGYHECAPGVVNDCSYFDAKAYYYTMAKRLPSLNVHCGRKGLEWLDTDGEEWGRFQYVLSSVERSKPLRNILAGNMAGSSPQEDATVPNRVWYSSAEGRVKIAPVPHSWGRFRAVGLLLVRSGAELLMRACHEGGKGVVYANTDSVHTTGPCPRVWADHGFTVGVKGTGLSETCHRGSYHVAGVGTKPYMAGDREYIPAERLPIPQVLYSSWLRG